MPKLITLEIDVTLIEKHRLVPGKKKNKKDVIPQYLKLVLIPTKQSNYGDWRDKQTHMVCQSVTKEERDKKVKGPILGNAIEQDGRDQRAPASDTAAPGNPSPEPGDDDVPF